MPNPSGEPPGGAEPPYRSLVEHLPFNIFRKDRDLRFTYVNERICRSMGGTPETILGKTDFDFSPPELAEKFQRDDRKVLETGVPVEDIE
jgi:PAS domain S-box-containing protein